MSQVKHDSTPNVSDFTSIQTIFLFVLHKYPNLTGTDIKEKIEKNIGSDWVPSDGTVYKVLKKLLKEGCITETSDITTLSNDRVRPYRRTYELTSCGVSFVKQQSNRMLQLVGFLYDCCPEYTDDYVITKVCKTDNC